jgi:multidrug resistance efflux pump
MNKTKTTICRSGRLHVHILPILVWLGAVACVVMLFHHRTQRFEVLGIAQDQIRQVAATCVGRLETVPVELFENVRRGQTVAVINTVLDNENTEAELAVISAEIQRLRAQLAVTREQLLSEEAERQTDKITANRPFNVDVENARLGILQLKTQIETDMILVEDLSLEVKIAQNLLKQDAIAPYELQKAEAQFNALAKTVEENLRLLIQAEQNLKQAQQRRDEFAKRQPLHPSVDNAMQVIRKEIAVQEQRMAQVRARKEPLALKAPIDGMVNLIQKGPGEAVLAGEPILTIVELQPSQIIAYVDENQISQVKERMVVRLIKNGNPGQIVNSQVVSLGPNVELMPQRLWRNPTVQQWGRAVVIKIPPALKLLPGQTVGIKGL